MKALREGNLAPSPVLKEMVEELESRRTLPAIRHYQATILNEEMRSPGQLDLRRMFERLPPHERTFLIERFEAERNSTVEERAGSRESNPWMVDSDQKWHFDSVRDLAGPAPAQIANDDFERIRDHDFGYDR